MIVSFLLLFIAVALIVFLTGQLQWHPFLVLILVSIGFGLASGMAPDMVLTTLQKGFGDTLGSIGIIIVVGLIIGTFFEKSGGAIVIANLFVRLLGSKRMHTAIAFMGYLISIPVYADSGFVILTPINKALTKKVGLSLAGTAVALGIGLTASHTMVPPTPGPLAAAAIIGADLGWVIVIGLVASILGLLICIRFSKYMGEKIWIESDSASPADEENTTEQLPSLTKTILPIFTPLLLIVIRAVVEYPGFPLADGNLKSFIAFIGHPITALLIGMFLAFRMPVQKNAKRISQGGWLGKAIQGSATIILITAAGGAFGKMIQASGFHHAIEHLIKTLPLGLLLPFLMAALIKTAQGSSTVALVTAASIVFPLLEALALTSTIDKALVVIAIGAGSAVVSHANDSFFWVITQFSGMSVPQGYRLHSLATLVLGLTVISILLIFKGLLGLFAG